MHALSINRVNAQHFFELHSNLTNFWHSRLVSVLVSGTHSNGTHLSGAFEAVDLKYYTFL